VEAITDLAALEALYGTPGEASLIKVRGHLTPLYAKWIMASRFCVLTTVGPEGTDGSPRGNDGPVVQMPDARTLLMPDWRGNNRIDSLRNILRDGRVSLMFMVPGSANVIRVNGTAILTADEGILARFDRDGTRPRCVIVITLAEVYSQCARALIRSGLWTSGDQSAGLPSVGDLLAEAKADFDGQDYDATWADRAAGTMW
jgi:PPOX class probable FMN-dependent enzyme